MPIAVAFLALMSPTAQSEAPVMPNATLEEPADPLQTDLAKPSLPTRALLRIGRDDLRTESFILGGVASAAWSPAGDRVVIGHGDGFVRVWDAATGELIWYKLLAPVIGRSGSNAYPAFVSYSHDGKLVVAAGRRDDPVQFEDGIVAVYEAASGRTVREVSQKQIRWAALAPNGRMVVAATSHGAKGDTHFIGVEVGTGQPRWANPPKDQRRGFYPVAVRLYDIETGEQVLTLHPSDGRAYVMVFSPDGKRLFTGFGRGSAIVWNVLPGQVAPTARE